MKKSFKVLLSFVLTTMLSACGGGGDGDANGTAEMADGTDTTQLRPTTFTSDGRAYNSCSDEPLCSRNPYAPFRARVWTAPVDGATISGVVRLEIDGNFMKNAELLPASGYLPRHGIFKINNDTSHATMDLDTTKLPNGPFTVRISAFDKPAGGTGAREIVAMTTRTWNINNSSTPSIRFSAAVTAAPANGQAISGIARLEIRGSGIANAELLPGSSYTPRLGVFNVSADRTYAWLDFDSRSVPDGVRNIRIAAYNVMAGQKGASEIIAMRPRNWTISNGSSSTALFTATISTSPPHGSNITGTILLEVRGTGLKNVELLPANGYTPRHGKFYVNFQGTYAYLTLDTNSLPAGPFEARVSAFNVPEGSAGAREIVVMPAREWNLAH
ncbi:hypothetical protein Q8A64_18380 [Oxalobacteraceae bacterium R-40]|uniref:Uncharacterized protein n=1 Tax=Keguizhuia sedimenti TaxID=3064264 RepID=A0ABU1BTN6_9BURK|nr:hypothetical protein [Oxalobacteraceae bacterium R-40]